MFIAMDEAFDELSPLRTSDFPGFTQLPSVERSCQTVTTVYPFDDASLYDALNKRLNDISVTDTMVTSVLQTPDGTHEKHGDVLALRADEDIVGFAAASKSEANSTVITGSGSLCSSPSNIRSTTTSNNNAGAMPIFNPSTSASSPSQPAGTPRSTIFLNIHLDPDIDLESLKPEDALTILRSLPIHPLKPFQVPLYDEQTEDGIPCRVGRQSHGCWGFVVFERDDPPRVLHPETLIEHQQPLQPHIQAGSTLSAPPVHSAQGGSGSSLYMPVSRSGSGRRPHLNTTSQQPLHQIPGPSFLVPRPNHRPTSHTWLQAQQQIFHSATPHMGTQRTGYPDKLVAYPDVEGDRSPAPAYNHSPPAPAYTSPTPVHGSLAPAYGSVIPVTDGRHQPVSVPLHLEYQLLNGPYIGSKSRSPLPGTIHLPIVPRVPSAQVMGKRKRGADAEEGETSRSKKTRSAGGRSKKQMNMIASA